MSNAQTASLASVLLGLVLFFFFLPKEAQAPEPPLAKKRTAA
jgi:hypothetical protein